MTYPYRDLREALATLEAEGLLKHVTKEVDKNWELSCIMRWVYQGYAEEDRYAIMFDKVSGYNIPVVVGAIGASYKTYATCLGIDHKKPKSEVIKEIRQRWINAIDKPIEPRIVSTGPCKENILKGAEVDIHKFPIPVWTPEKDCGWDKGYGFLTSPYHITKDPGTGIRNVGTYRSMVREEPNVLGAGHSVGSHIRIHRERNESEGKATEIATVIGADPTIGMISVTPVPYGIDELALAGGLRREAVELVKCETVDLEVPATAEIVIEGRLPPKQERAYEYEGPFGEYTGYQGSATLQPVQEVTCITYRNNAIYQAFISQTCPSESSKLTCLSWEALLLRQLHALGIQAVDIHLPETAQGAVVIVSIRKFDEGHPARVANAVFATLQAKFGKFVIVTDDDVDVHDLDDVIWAISFRTSLTPTRRKISFIEGLNGQSLDYSAAPSMELMRSRLDWPSAGVLIDATRPYKPYPTVSLPPAKYLKQVRDGWRNYGLPDLEKPELPKSITMEEEYLKEGRVANPEFK